MTVRFGRSLLLPLIGLLVFACTASRSEDVIIATRPDAGTPGFDRPDATTQADGTRGGGLCPTNVCPEGRTTCPHSPFPCTDLLTDDNNCGACGNVCPRFTGSNQPNMHGDMHCVEGECRLTCSPGYADCNAHSEDGCEAVLNAPTSCGECGIVCAANERCSGQTYSETCECAIVGSCGACGHICDPPGPDQTFPEEWNAEYGCQSGQCNQPGCKQGYADCNNNFEPGKTTGDGCEINTDFDSNNCGGCGIKCLVADGEVCEGGQCRCRCGGKCSEKSLDSDIKNCGACHFRCPEADPYIDDHATVACNSGACGFQCNTNWADCDGNRFNGCETNVENDPVNCGGCGIRCDGIEGQACVGGRCTMKECDIQ